MSNSSVDRATAEALIWDGELKQAKREDWISIFAPLQKAGFQWDAVDEILVRPGATMGRFISANTPWVHVKGSPHKNCNFDHSICFTHFGIIPPRCLECWKVTVTPKSYHEMTLLEEIERACPYSCKLGIELRQYVPKHYGGYFYNNSLDEGRECYEWVRKAVDEHIGKDNVVLLKRGCTEYEMLKGPSPFWHMSPEEEKKFELLQSFVKDDKANGAQPAMVQRHIRLRWAQWAHSNGDFSYVPYNGGQKLYPDYVKYHEGDINGIKQDLAIARAYAKGGISGQDTVEFQTLAQEYADAKKLPVTALIHTLGAHELNPLRGVTFEKQLEEIPEENVGEQDQASTLENVD